MVSPFVTSSADLTHPDLDLTRPDRSLPQLSATVSALERTLAADRALADATALEPRLHERADKVRRRTQGVLRDLGSLLASSPPAGSAEGLDGSVDAPQLRQVTARLSSCERRINAITYDASLVDLGAG